MALVPDFQIAAGHDAVGDLEPIEDIIPSGDWRGFVVPDAFATFSPGTIRVRGDGTIYITGYPSTTWLFPALSRKQYNYLRTTFCAGGLSGAVTIRTMIEDGTFDNFNAIITIPDLPSINRQRRGNAFEDVEITYTFLEEAA